MKYPSTTILSILSIITLALAIINSNKVKTQSGLISLQSDLIADLRAELEEPNFESLFAKNIKAESITVIDEDSSPRVAIGVSNSDSKIILKDANGVTRVAIKQTDNINSIELASTEEIKSYIAIGDLESSWAPTFFAGWLQSNEAYNWLSEDWTSGVYLSLADSLNNFAMQTWADTPTSRPQPAAAP